eukprot:2753718-Pleurochrysis_carterae.AAC.1
MKNSFSSRSQIHGVMTQRLCAPSAAAPQQPRSHPPDDISLRWARCGDAHDGLRVTDALY